MPDQNDPEELLRASNPVNSFTMNPDRQNQMVAGILDAHGPATSGPSSRSWKVKAVSAAAVAALAISVVVVLTDRTTTPKLNVLSIKSVQLSALGSSVGGPSHGGPGTRGGHGASGPITFVAGADLSTAPSSAPVYSFTPHSDPTSEVMNVAATLGVMNARVIPGGNNGCGVEVSGDSSSVYTDCNPTTEWIYNMKLPPCHGVIKDASGRFVPCPVYWGLEDSGATDSQLSSWSAAAAATLTPAGMTLGSPTFGPTLNVVTYPCEFNAAAVLGCAETFWYTNEGKLTEASGPLEPDSQVTQLGVYPLVSPHDAVSQVAGNVVFHGPSGTGSGPVVSLTSSVLLYAVAYTDNGAGLLVPAYSYSGSDGGTYSTLAVSPSLIASSAVK